jgi:hypothetical protein
VLGGFPGRTEGPAMRALLLVALALAGCSSAADDLPTCAMPLVRPATCCNGGIVCGCDARPDGAVDCIETAPVCACPGALRCSGFGVDVACQ